MTALLPTLYLSVEMATECPRGLLDMNGVANSPKKTNDTGCVGSLVNRH